MANKLTKKAFREVLNERHQEKVEREQKRLHALPKDFVQREMDMTMGNGVYHARKRKQGDYLYAQDPEMFNNLFEEWKVEELKKGCGLSFDEKPTGDRMKVKPETKKLMIEMRDKGFTLEGIGKRLGLAQSTVNYHLCEDVRKKTIARSIRNAKPWSGKKEYMRKYMKKRYREDLEFREKMKEDNKLNQRKRRGTK